ncbi:MAG: carbamoyltransferase HypF [Bryobacteraceae bacterium]
MNARYRITVTGVVQGVGFRPFVKRVADRLGVAGRVSNTAGGVVIEIETAGPKPFLAALLGDAPPNARIASCSVERLPAAGYASFEIDTSRGEGGFTLVSRDVATCADCLREIRDPADRRFGYAFTNCTNCGPRYSITRRVPYDRPNTTMEPFRMCAACAAEYADPADRRFHAEPNACPACGPRLSMGIGEVRAALRAGNVVALKSIGGFQLACDALNRDAVARLRAKKRRSRKPFAVMMRDLATTERYCRVDEEERALLISPEAPIVLLRTRDPAAFPPELAPGLRELGVMLPYTPLHHLLFEGLECLVMTSGNISEEPIVISNEEARVKLAGMAEVFLAHDREIFMRVDDSVVRRGGVVRRARGYAPDPIDLGRPVPEVLACGGELKNTFCLTRGQYAIPSQHIGDLENYETLAFFEETLRNLKSVYRAEPRLIAHDLHPDYLSTRWALAQRGPKLAVQHHHAHIASCMAENRLNERVIGVAFDGTGYGADGQIWGGEFLICDYAGFERVAHLRYVPLAGGDQAIREAARMAAAHLYDAFGAGFREIALPIGEARWKLLEQVFARTPLRTSSCGRLFDAVSALTGTCHLSTYEGEAAMLLEAASGADAYGAYPFALENGEIDTRPLIRGVAADLKRGFPAAVISSRFHTTMAAIIEAACREARDATGLDAVCLSGGTFQNRTLVARAAPRLMRAGFRVYTHRLAPPNDGGLSLGQAAVACAQIL